jgi:hypothetical protein
MLKVYPFASGSEYTASFAITASSANSADLLAYAVTASVARTGSLGPQGLRGSPDVCIITFEQYLQMSSSFNLIEDCRFPPR